MDKQELIAQKQQEICNLTAKLSSPASRIGDWKIAKTYEARLQDKADPYDTDKLIADRQAIRDEINRIQQEIKDLENE